MALYGRKNKLKLTELIMCLKRSMLIENIIGPRIDTLGTPKVKYTDTFSAMDIKKEELYLISQHTFSNNHMKYFDLW